MGIKVALRISFVACMAAAAMASCSGRLAGSGPAGAGPDAGGCGGGPPTSAMRAASLTMTQVNFGDSPGAWQSIGFDLDGKCTTAASTDVCQLAAGAPRAMQTDGVSGIDNSFGENVCPIMSTLFGTGACSTRITLADIVTDELGSGILVIHVAPYWIEIPIVDAYVTLDGGSGTFGGVTTAAGFWTATGNASAALVDGSSTTCVCGGCAFDGILQQLGQASDLLKDGSNPTGRPCDAISIGMTFSGATPFTGALPDVPDACGS